MGNTKSDPVVPTLTPVVPASVPMPVGESGEKEANQQPVPVCKDPPPAHAPLTFLPVGTQHSRAKHNLRLAVMKVEALNRFKGDHLNGCSRVCKGKPEEKITLDPNEPPRLVFVGLTGSGKSSLCTALTGQDLRGETKFKIGKGAKSETVTCNKLSLPWLGDTGNGKFVCIDTPGLNDSEGRDDMLINDIVGSMKEVEYVTAVVIVVNSSEARFNKALQDVLHRFEEAFCGPAEDPEDPTRPDPEYEKRCNFFYENILVVFQRWKMNEDAAADREDDGITEESVAKDFNCQLRAKFPYCNKDVPCVFVDSHDRKPERKNPTLLRVRDLVPPDVFRTQSVNQIVPRIQDYDGTDQIITNGTKIVPMRPVLVDKKIEIDEWTIYPPAPQGLEIRPCGSLTGVPKTWSPRSTHQIKAKSKGGQESKEFKLGEIGSKANLFHHTILTRRFVEIEIGLSKSDFEQEIASASPQIKTFLKKVIDGAKVASEEDLKSELQKVEAAKNECLAKLTTQFESKYPNMKSLPELIERTKTAARRISLDFSVQLQAMQSKYVSEQQKKEMEFINVKQNVKDLLCEFTEDYDDLKIRVDALKSLAIPEGYTNKTLGRAIKMLEEIEPVTCSSKYCPHKCMRRDIEAHKQTCIFAMPLKHQSQIIKVRSNNCDDALEIESNTHGEWNGEYTKGQCPHIDGDKGEGYWMVNQGEKRIQRVLPTGHGAVKWTVQSWAGEGTDKVVFMSTNEAATVAGVKFNGMEIKPPVKETSWSTDQKLSRVMNHAAPKLVYFSGKWCPYCPPFTAKLKLFYEILHEHFSDNDNDKSPIEIVFISWDQTEEAMFNYFGGHHGDWFALPYEHRETKEKMDEKFEVGGIPWLKVIGNDSTEIKYFSKGGEFEIANAIRALPDNKKTAKSDVIKIYKELIKHYKTAAEIEGEQEKQDAEERAKERKMSAFIANQKLILENQHQLNNSIHNMHLDLKSGFQKFDDKIGDVINAVYEATEVQVPSSFIILPHKIPATTSEDLVSYDGSTFQLALGCADTALEKANEAVETANRAAGWLSKLSNIGSALMGGHVGEAVSGAVDTFMQSALGQDHLYLYLIDELTGLPVIPEDEDSVYPIDIKVDNPNAVALTKKLLPVMRTGLQVATLLNGTASIGRLFGFPVPTIPEALTGAVESAVKVSEGGSNLAGDFDKLNACVQETVEGEGEEAKKSIRGGLLREFGQMLKKYDEGEDYCGLRRRASPDGHALWTVHELE
ncbi:hypothetical protein TL16_g12809 [Triparma laevis f. inornata]|uniref:protein-disulfide reductase n=1 Tax=Triparma laevis f. inornata TaxID=1714386 RepID=A0A9W7BPB9_9STRA|nr:hypothetical protein TL16_g12809 [Triparma laevis f. inornata]